MRQAVSRQGRRGLAAALVCVLGGALVAAFAPSSPARAAVLVAYRASASADGLSQQVYRPDAPIANLLANPSTPSAQASLDNLGNSTAYASFFYPGDLVLQGPGLAAGLTNISLPGYPVIAQSSSPYQPDVDSSTGPVISHATSSPTASMGTAQITPPAEGIARLSAVSSVTGSPATGSLTAVATSEATGIDVAGVLTITSVRAKAEVDYVGGTAKATSSMSLGDITIAGIRVALTPTGLVLPGTTLPVGSAILKPLTAAGVSFELVQPEKLVGGIRSGGLRITQTQNTPGVGGSVTTTTIFGQAIALASATSDAAVVPPVTIPVVTPPVPPSTTGGQVTVPVTTPVGPVTAPVVPTDPGQPTVAPPITQPAPVALRPVAAAGNVPFGVMNGLSFYLILVLAGAVALAAQKALRRYGVSATWTS